MLKFIRGKGQQPSAERQKLQQELFAFQKTVQHGFPNRASALAWDPLLRLMALGTASGALKVYGRPGVEFYGQHAETDTPVTHIEFIPGTGRLVSLCDDNSLHLWEINEKSLVALRSLALDNKQKRVSSLCVEASGDGLLIGTEAGNVYTLDLATFAITEDVIYQDVVMQSCPDDYKKSPGAVEHVCEHPTAPRLLLGYERGLMVLWDRAAARPTHTFVSTQQLHSLCWSDKGGDSFVSSHNDGSYVSWEVSASADACKPLKEPVTPYGPYACKPINKILSRSAHNGEHITIFSGGMPRASYSDKYTVTVQQGEKHVAFDFTSRVIDFFTTPPGAADNSDVRPRSPAQIQSQSVFQPASALVVLAEEELVVIDLCSDRLKPIRPATLVSLHASAVTTTHIGRLTDKLYSDIKKAGLKQTEDLYSDAGWPITGGSVQADAAPEGSDDESYVHEVLLTGHEDGSVRFWDIDGVVMTPLYKFTTAQLFSGEEVAEPSETNEEEEWPPFRRVGAFDPYSDDPRLAVKKVLLCPLTGQLTVGGAAGHVVVAGLRGRVPTPDVKYVTVNLVSDRDGFVWKGHDPLTLRGALAQVESGYQPSSVLQTLPPAAVTSLSGHMQWDLVAVGTAHGLILYDVLRCSPVYHKCTLLPGDAGAGDTPISRRKSFKKSLRESFRRLRKGRSQRQRQTGQPATTPTQVEGKKTVTIAEAAETGVDARPIERPVEARQTDTEYGSMVRCLYFARTYLLNTQNSNPTLWAGTNNGTVYAFTLTIPNVRRTEDPVSCQLAKEIQLKHRAPVIGITILDCDSIPIPEPLETETTAAALPDGGPPHRVLIASEEQFKIFTLPSLKPYCKYKLTAHEGSRVRRMGFAWFECKLEDGPHKECCLVCLTNLGDCLLLSVPELRRQLNAAAARKEDINGISSLTFSKKGEALYLHSSSELQRITLSATTVTTTHCRVPLAPWAAALRAPADPPASVLHNGEVKEAEVTEREAHDVTAASGDITVDSVRDHTTPTQPDTPLNINLQNTSVNTSSMVVKTTTRTSTNDNTTTETAATNITSTTDNILEHSREEGVITRIETGTVTVPAGTDPKLILEMFERARSPLAVPVPPPGATVVNHSETTE